ncbi:MAG TPA: Xaa-Pro dipeptidyl-peptidase [Solirubrobacter sp.]|nr:Xaa-Pro dipeptidyl-peptidase [Solirubrobacter sp.]
MKKGRRLAAASAITATLALAGAVGTASALPPKGATFPGVARSAAAPAPAVPTFVNGMAQAVFATGAANWVNHELWVELDVDTDFDGVKDRVHVDVSRPIETETDGLKVPVIYEDSPYYAGGADVANWAVNHEIGTPPAQRLRAPDFNSGNTSPTISTIYETTWVPRGFAVVHSESPGSGNSTGCPNSGATIETLGATAVIDWLNGRRKGYTTKTGTTEVTAYWHNGNTGMMGTSYNGTLPIAAASTGVEGLKAIVPISAISDWYDYYRANGAVRAPGGFQGEDLDVLTEYIYTRNDEGPHREICWPTINQVAVSQDRATGNRSAFWDERNYMKDVAKVKAAALVAHGNNDFNVMTKHAAQFYEALKANNVPHQFYFHQGGHGGAPPDYLLNLWFTRFLWNHENGVENRPKSYVVRNEAGACPPRETTVVGDQSNTATLTVANTAPFDVGTTLTVPQTNASGTITNTTRVITNIPDATHLTLASAVATAAGQRVADGAVVSLVCGNANPTPYPEWPDPATVDAVLKPNPGGLTRGALTVGGGGSGQETLIDDAGVTPASLMNNPAGEDSRLLYVTNPLTQPVRISGTPRVSINAAFAPREDGTPSPLKANLTAYLVSLPGGSGNGTVLTRGWIDPENRNSDYVSEPLTAGTFYRLNFDLQPKDVVVAAGRRLGLMILSSDRDFTVRPAPGTKVTVDLAGTSFTLPVVGGAKSLATATGGDLEDGTVTGTVPATLSLSLGAPATFGAFTPGVGATYEASTTANVISSAGDATLSVADPSSTATGRLVNGSFALAAPVQARANAGAYADVGGSANPTSLLTYDGPVSNDAVTLGFRQAIGANEALRTGTYSKTLTFTLSTTTP